MMILNIVSEHEFVVHEKTRHC